MYTVVQNDHHIDHHIHIPQYISMVFLSDTTTICIFLYFL